jgi:hypothetical protein
MRKLFFSFFLLISGLIYSQSNSSPIATDVYTSTKKNTELSVHLVGSDSDITDNLTYSIVSISTHGTLKDPLNGNAILVAGSTLSSNGNVVTFVPGSSKYSSYIESGTTSFTYKVNDGIDDSAEKIVYIKVFDDFLASPSLKGSEITGDNPGDSFGQSIAMSENGDLMAVGAPLFGSGDKGSVKVLKYTSGSGWAAHGNVIEGASDGDKFGSGVSLNGDGSVLAVGAAYANSNRGQVTIYSYNSGTNNWDLIGTIDGTNIASPKSISEQFGNDVRLSKDGKTLAVSDLWHDSGSKINSGRVVVYRYQSGTTWNILGSSSEISGESGDNLGWAVDLSSNGNILAVGAHENDTGKNVGGQVKIFQYNGSTDTWENKGIIYPTDQISNERFGSSVDLNSSGLIVAVGSRYDKPNSKTAEGSVSVYNWLSGTTWNRLGSEIKDEVGNGDDAKFDYFGSHVSINNPGTILGVVAPGFDGNKGNLRLYSYDSELSRWTQIPSTTFTIPGENASDYTTGSGDEAKGQKVFISGDGSSVALGADLNDSGGTDSGHVRVYNLYTVQQIPSADSQTVAFNLYEQLTSSEEIVLTASDSDSGPNNLGYVITELNTAKLYEGSTEISSSDIPYSLTGNKVKYNSNSDSVVNDSFKFVAHDGDGGASSVPATVSLTVIPDNDKPVSIADNKTTDEDTVLDITLTATDVDSPASDFTYTIDTFPTNGILKQGGYEVTANSTSIWNGPNITFTKSGGTDPTLQANQDRLTGEVWITRGNDGGQIFNIMAESVYNKTNSPTGTKWAIGTLDQVSTLTFSKFRAAVGNPKDVVGKNLVMYLENDNIYLSVKFTSWENGNGKAFDNGFSYERSTPGADFTYTPNPNFSESDSFTFKVTDKGINSSTDTDVEISDPATISINVNNTDNDPPLAENKSVSASQDTETATIALVASDPDDDDSSLVFSIATLPSNGILKDGGTEITGAADISAALTYSPNNGYTGNDSFTFTAKDDQSATSTAATVSISVSDSNDPPVATAKSITVNEDVESETIVLEATDPDTSDTSFTYSIATLPANGTLKDGETVITKAGDISGTLTYISNNNYVGNDSFTFTAKDDESAESSAATVSITVNNVNDPPVAQNQSITTREDTTTSPVITLSATDPDTSDDTFTYTIKVLPTKGILKDGSTEITAIGTELSGASLTYTPDLNYNGNDSFNFSAKDDESAESADGSVSLTITPWNDPPVAIQQNLSTGEDTSLNITVSGTDVDGDDLTYFLYSLPINGTLEQGGTTIVDADLPKTLTSLDLTYVPNAGYNGSDTFKFKARDLTYESFSTANNMVVINNGGTPVTYETEYGKTYFLIQSTPTKMDWPEAKAITDSYYGARMYVPLNAEMENSVYDALQSMSRLDGPFWMGLYQDRSATDYSEPSGGWYWVNGNKLGDGYTNWYDGEPNDAGDEDYGQFNFGGFGIKWNDMSVGNGQSYAMFEFTAEDSTAEININITEVNDPPVANNQSVETDEDVPLTIKLTGSDPENDPLTYLIKSLPTYGKLKEGGNEILASELPRLLPADSLSYHPNADYNGSDSFDFMINANFLNAFSKANGLKFIEKNGEPVTFDKPKGKTYFLIQNETGQAGFNPIDWPDARDLAKNYEGAEMYIVKDETMEKMVWDALTEMGLTSGQLYWMGLYQDRTVSDYIEPGDESQNFGGWRWTDGTKLLGGYTNWKSGEPNEAGPEDYGQINFHGTGEWNDMRIGSGQSWPLFEFAITGSSESNTAKISINVKSVNDMPVADSINLSTLEETPLDITLNATDPEGVLLMDYVVKSLPANGDLSENNVTITTADLPKTLSGKNLTFVPNDDYNGTESFDYYVIDKNCPNTNSSTLTVSGDFTASASGTNPMVIPPQNIKGTASVNQKQVDIKFSVGQGDIFQSCQIKLDVRSFDDGLQFTIDGVNLLSFSQQHWDPAFGASTTEFSGNGRFATSGSLWAPWNGDGNPKLEIASGKIKLMVDTKNGTREDVLPFMDTSRTNWALVSNFTYDCEAGFNLLIGNHNGGGGAGGIDADLTVEAFIVPCEESNVAKVTMIVDPVNDPPESDPQTVETDEDLAVDITHVGRDKDLVDIFTVHTQMGADIPQTGQIGESLALSSDGKRIILGEWNPASGNAKVFDWDGTNWKQVGASIDGSSTGDIFGENVTISSEGNRVAVAGPKNDNASGTDAGHVKVYDYDGSKWNQVGSEIIGNATNDYLGFRGMHLSGDGNVLVIASFRGGYVNTYQWNGTDWIKSATISISKGSTESPGQVYLSIDGKRLAIGVTANGSKGQVSIYDWNGIDTWNLYKTIDGTVGRFGNTIDLTRDSKKIAIGQHDSSSVSVYDISGPNPVRIGVDIPYENQSSYWRYISLSDDGSRLGIPIMGTKLGVFDWDGTSWKQLGADIISTGLTGESFDMSANGKIMAGGGHSGPNKIFNILNLSYIITTYPANGILQEGSKTISLAELPYTLKGTDATYVPNSGFFGQDKYNFKLNDGKADSTDKVSGLREDSQVTINIKEFVLELPNNYTLTPTETCKGSDFGIIDIEVAATSYKKTASGPDIPITYKISIEGKGELATITSPDKTAQIKNLPEGKHKLIFKVVQEPKYEEVIEFEIIGTDPPVAYPVTKLEACDDTADGDDTNGKVDFDTSTVLTSLLKNPTTGVLQDEKLFDIEFTYFDEASAANVTAATLPNPFYSSAQTISVKFTSKANGSCIANQTIDLQVNTLPVFERIEDVKSVCTNLDPVTIGVASKDSRNYTYTWTRNGTDFPPNITGVDSSITIGLGGEYVVTATTTDGTNCSQSMTIQIKESSIANLQKKDIEIKDLQPGPNNTGYCFNRNSWNWRL